MSSEQDPRRRPFSVNDMNRRTREVKIFNTTTITTTTSTSSHDSSILTTTITNRGVGNRPRAIDNGNYNYSNVQYDEQPIIISSSRPQDHRSRSAYDTSYGDNININSEYRDSRQTTNSTTTVPGKRKIKFVYGGDDQQNVDPNSKILKEKSSDYETTPKTSPILNEKIRYQYENNDPVTNETNIYSSNENLPGFPYVQSSLSHTTSDAIITNSVVINSRCRDGSRRIREPRETVETQEKAEKYDNQETEKDDLSECNMVVKDVEVECEIDEDPSIFEGSEGYVKNLISKIQNQYKNPETVHIKIVRRQKPENIDKSGNIIKKSENESYGQIVRKEYYTLKASPRHRKRTNVSSFVDTTNIPFIDDEASESKRNSKAYDYENRGPTPPNYVIEKHIIYSDCENEQNEITQVIRTVQRKSLKERNEEEKTKKKRGVRSLVKTLSRSSKKDKPDKQDKRFVSESPTRASKKKKDYSDGRDISLPIVDASLKKPKVTVEHDIDAEEPRGIRGFFKGFNGRIKAPEIDTRDLSCKREEINLDIDKPKIDLKASTKDLDTRPVKDEYEIGLPNVDVDLHGPKVTGPSFDADLDINAPEVKGGIKGFFKGIGGKIKAPDVHIPEVSVKSPKIDVPDVSLKGPKYDLPDVNIKGPKIEAPDLSYKPPKFESPDLSYKAPKVDLPEIAIETGLPNVDVDLQGPRVTGPSFDADLDLNAPDVKGGIKGFFKGIGGKIKAPDVHIPDVSVKTPKIDVPDLSIKGPKYDIPDVNIKGPKIEAPDVNLRGPKFETPDLSYKAPKVDLPEIAIETGLPNVDLDLQGAKITGPAFDADLDLNAPDVKGGIKGFFKGIGGKIKAPDVHIPDLSVKTPKIDVPDVSLKGPKYDLPDVNIKGPKIEAPDLSYKTPKVDLPEIAIETGLPNVDVDLQGPKITGPAFDADFDLNAPDVKGGIKGFFKGIGGKIKAPDVHIPDVAIKTPKIEVPDVKIKGPKIEAPDLSYKPPKFESPDLSYKAPKVDLPEIAIETGLPNVDVDLQGPIVSRPNFDADLDLNAPEVKGGIKGFFKGIGGKIKAPDVHIPDVSVKTPKIDVPDLSIKGPKYDIPDVSIKGPKIEAPDINLRGPKFDTPKVDLPEIGIETGLPNVDVDLQGPRLTGPSFDADLDINAPEVKGGIKGFFKGIGGKIKAPDVHIPDVTVKTPKVDIPDLSIKGPKYDLPDVSIKGPKIETPDLSYKPPKVDLPEIAIETGLPNVDLDLQGPSITGPSLDADIDLNAPDVKGGIKGFFKGIGGKIKAPDVHIPDVSVKTPKIDVPDISLKGPKYDIPDVSIKGPKIEAPDLSYKVPKFETPELSYKTPKVDLPEIGIETGLPNVDFDLQGPKITGPAFDADLDLNAPDVKGGIKGFFKGIGGKIKAPDVHIPDVSVKTPKIDVPDVSIKGPKYDLPDVNIKGPKIEAPDLSYKAPKVDLPEIGIETGLPNVDIDLQGPRITGPNIDADLDLNAPEVKGGIKGFFKGIGGKIKAPDVHIPDVAIKTPKIDVPDVNIKGPKIEAPDFNLRGPKFDTPDLSYKPPKVDLPEIAIETGLPNVDLDLQGPKVTGPSFDADIDINAPEVKGGIKGFFKGIGGKIKAPDVHIPDVSVKTPKIDVPDVTLKGPKYDLPDVNIKGPKIEAPDVNLRGPKFDTPDLSYKPPKVDLPEIGIETGLPNVDVDLHGPRITGPSIDTDFDINAPDVKGGIKGFFKGIGGKIKAPDVHIPDVSLKTPKIDVPDVKLKGPKYDLPDVSIKGPKIEAPDLSYKTPKFETPELTYKTPKVDLPEVAFETGLPNVDVDLQGPKITGPSFDADLDLNAPDVKGGIKGFFKGIGGKIKAPDVHIPDVSVKTPKVDLPDVSIKGPKYDLPDVSFKGPKIEAPDLSYKTPKFETPELSYKTPKVDLPEIAVETGLPNVDVDLQGPRISGPSFDADLDLNAPDLKGGIKGFFRGIGGKIKAPDVHIPDIGLKSQKYDLPDVSIRGPRVDSADVSLRSPKYENYDSSLIISPHTFPDVTFKSDLTGDVSISQADGSAAKLVPTTFGFDLPMTVVNSDWHWSTESSKNNNSDRRIFHRTYVDYAESTSSHIGSGTFAMGDMTYFQNTDFTSSSSKKIEVEHYVTRPQSSLATNFTPPSIEYEFKKAKIRKDPQIFTPTSVNVNTNPGDINITAPSTSETTSQVKSSSSGFFRRKLSSSSSSTNINSKKGVQTSKSSANRSESADPSNRTKIDYSLPRKCYLFTRPDFNGLGIHIACDKKSRRSPYIHEVEADSPGIKAGLRKHDYILQVNDEDAVNMDFNSLISKIQNLIKENNLCLTVGNEKAYKKWIKNNRSKSDKSSSDDKSKK